MARRWPRPLRPLLLLSRAFRIRGALWHCMAAFALSNNHTGKYKFSLLLLQAMKLPPYPEKGLRQPASPRLKRGAMLRPNLSLPFTRIIKTSIGVSRLGILKLLCLSQPVRPRPSLLSQLCEKRVIMAKRLFSSIANGLFAILAINLQCIQTIVGLCNMCEGRKRTSVWVMNGSLLTTLKPISSKVSLGTLYLSVTNT